MLLAVAADVLVDLAMHHSFGAWRWMVGLPIVPALFMSGTKQTNCRPSLAVDGIFHRAPYAGLRAASALKAYESGVCTRCVQVIACVV